MDKGAVISGLAGLGVGVIIGKIAPVFAEEVPSDIEVLLNTLRFHDVQRGVDINKRTIMSYGKEDSWCIWNIGYGVNGYVSNDVIMDLGWNMQTGEVGASIGKLAWNAVEVYKNGELLATLPQYGFCWFE